MATDAEVEIAAEAMMRADWAASARSRPPDADVKSYYAMARAALRAVDGVRLQWTPKELAALANPNAPPVFTVRDERASSLTTFKRVDE